MKSQQKYWDKKITEWTRASYDEKLEDISLIEKMANLFRGPITKRMDVALEIIGPKAKGKIVADFGCGLGDFCFEALKYEPKKLIGIDISGVAVEEARKKSKKMKLEKKIEFVQADLGQLEKLPRFDIAVGLGFIDYLDKDELRQLFKLLTDHYFLFSVFEKKISLRNLVHGFYIKIKGCPGAFKFTRRELMGFVPKDANACFLEKDKMLFITNLPA